jgi:hypothetical protein
MNFSKFSKMRVLICSVGAAVPEGFETDSAVYQKYYKTVVSLSVSRKNELLSAIEGGYDIVHLFSRCSAEGALSDLEDGTFGGTELIHTCARHRAKLLWIATSNASSSYINGFRAKGSSLNLIMTLDRKGDHFKDFLDQLLSRVSSGETLPHAWAALAPQKGGSGKGVLPDCIFFAPGPPLSLRG